MTDRYNTEEAAVKEHIDALRKIREHDEALADHMISLWGSHDFLVLIHDLKYSHTEIFNALSIEVSKVKSTHYHLFPHLHVPTHDELPIELANSEEFALVHQRFPHIGDRLLTRWGTKEYLEYLESLLKNSSGKQRQGFPYDIYSALFKLSNLHAQLFPQLVKNPLDKWWEAFD